jgi:rhamnosyltransferase subunit B
MSSATAVRHFILCPMGSGGDVYPFIGIGRALLARGHRVTLVGLDLFAEAALTAGLGFESFGTVADFDHFAADARLWSPLRGPQLVFGLFVEAMPRYLAALRRCMLGQEVVGVTLVSSGAVFAARLLREQLGVKQVVVHLQPAVFLSAYETPVYLQGTAWMLKLLPVWLKRLTFRLPNPIDFMVLPAVRELCLAEGVKPPRSVWHEWWHSPDGTLALFPEWFAAPQPDWPVPLFQHSFPMEDLGVDQDLSAELKTFLAVGERPVVFTLGTGNQHALRFFTVAARVVEELGLRAVFATRYPERNLPAQLPAGVLVVKYAPFSRLLPHCAALVSHGGVGTCSQAMAAGVPHLIMALAHDQPDNAQRLKRLGIGEGLAQWQFTVRRVVKWLLRVQADVDLPVRLQAVQELMRQRPPMSALAQWLEGRG